MKKFLALIFLLGFLTGCDQPAVLFSGLTERQANPVLAALLENGIRCQKKSGTEENTWNVELVSAQDFARAVSICQERGIPERVYNGVSEAFKKTGMVSSPSEERIRFMDALAQDLSRTISEIDGVINARVHVVLPDNDPFAKNTLPSSAAVALRCRYDVDMTDVIPQIKNLVMNSIEGLTYEKISVTVFRDTPAIVVNRPRIQTTGESTLNDAKVLRVLVTGCGVLLVVLAAAIAWVILLARRKAKAQPPAKAPAADKPAA